MILFYSFCTAKGIQKIKSKTNPHWISFHAEQWERQSERDIELILDIDIVWIMYGLCVFVPLFTSDSPQARKKSTITHLCCARLCCVLQCTRSKQLDRNEKRNHQPFVNFHAMKSCKSSMNWVALIPNQNRSQPFIPSICMFNRKMYGQSVHKNNGFICMCEDFVFRFFAAIS